MFSQIFAYINEKFLYIINNILYFYCIKTFLNNNIINYIKIKTYIKIKLFIYIKKRYIYKKQKIIINSIINIYLI